MKEYCGSLGIKVSNIILDKVDTNFREHIEKYVSFSDEQKEKMIQPEDVASAVLYLLTTSKNVLISTITLDAFLWS